MFVISLMPFPFHTVLRQGIMDGYPRRGNNCNVIESFFDVFL